MELAAIVEARQQQIVALKQEVIAYKQKAHYWEVQFTHLKTHEAELKTELEELKALLKKREQQLFGRRSEKQTGSLEKSAFDQKSSAEKKKRGQQTGKQGHGRRDYADLPVVEEVLRLDEGASTCPCCGLPYQELAGSEDAEVLEVINVQAYRRVIRRKRYQRHCRCKENPDPKIVIAPPVARLLPKHKLGISIWALLLVEKYEYQHPMHRALEQLSGYGLSLALGTVTDGMKKLLRLFVPVYDAIVERSLLASHWHADETGWKVFEWIEGKKNHRWFLWIFHHEETVIYKISPSRSSQVLHDHFGEDHTGGILNVDRYAAYKVIAKSGVFILAFCWAHVRRDFLEYAKGYEHQESWAFSWVARIGKLYHLNNQRIEHATSSKLFHPHHQTLQIELKAMKDEINKQREDTVLPPSARKLLTSLHKHWDGLTVFVDHSDIPMDNNAAERGLRSSVVGRKNYYGSGSVWSAKLAAALFSIFKTIKLSGLNPHTWLLAYLHECAMNNASPPENINKFLPWHMSSETKKLYAEPPAHEHPT